MDVLSRSILFALNAVKYSTPVVTVLKLLAHRERVSVVILLPFQIILTAQDVLVVRDSY